MLCREGDAELRRATTRVIIDVYPRLDRRRRRKLLRRLKISNQPGLLRAIVLTFSRRHQLLCCRSPSNSFQSLPPPRSSSQILKFGRVHKEGRRSRTPRGKLLISPFLGFDWFFWWVTPRGGVVNDSLSLQKADQIPCRKPAIRTFVNKDCLREEETG